MAIKSFAPHRVTPVNELVREPGAPIEPAQANDVVADLVRFEETVLAQLERVGLPTDAVLVDMAERESL